MLGKPECLTSEPFETISVNRLAAFSAHRNAETRGTEGIRRDVKTHKPLAAKELMSYHPAEVRLAAQPLGSSEQKTRQFISLSLNFLSDRNIGHKSGIGERVLAR